MADTAAAVAVHWGTLVGKNLEIGAAALIAGTVASLAASSLAAASLAAASLVAASLVVQ